MFLEIPRPNEIQRLERKLQSPDKEVSVAQPRKTPKKKTAVTRLGRELVAQVQGLVEEVAWLKRQFLLQELATCQ